MLRYFNSPLKGGEKVKKVALLCVMVMTVSLVPIFAADQINNTTQDQVQNQTALNNQTTTQEQLKTCTKENCTKENCTTNGSCNCDNQHKYQNGQKNDSSVAKSSQHKYKYGLKKVVSGSKNCNNYQNCAKK